MNIKDPAFISQKNRNYTFDFGKIQLAVIVKCKNGIPGALCLSQSLVTEDLNVGIESRNPKKDTSNFVIRDCKPSETIFTWSFAFFILKVKFRRMCTVYCCPSVR